MSGIDFIEAAVCTNPIFYVVGLARLNSERVVRDREAFFFSVIVSVWTRGREVGTRVILRGLNAGDSPSHCRTTRSGNDETRQGELLALSSPRQSRTPRSAGRSERCSSRDARLIPPSIARSVRSACSASGSGRCRARPIWRRAGRRRGAGVPRPGSEPGGTRSRSPSIAVTRTNRA
jgi:hypothetical protein